MDEFIKQIEQDGYCKISQLYRPEQIEKALSLTKEWYLRIKDSLADNLPALAKNDHFVWNLQSKDYYFLEMLFGPAEIQNILTHFLNDKWYKQIPPREPNYILRSLMCRSSNRPLPMHIDSMVPYRGQQVFVMQASIILEDQTESNGCTVVVPGSHQSGEFVDQSAFDIATPIESKAGDVLIWDSRIWHGAKENKSGGTRWAIIATFTRWWIKQMFNIPKTLPQSIYEKLTDSQKAILGFCSIPYNCETEGVDMKKGYDSLSQYVSAYQGQRE